MRLHFNSKWAQRVQTVLRRRSPRSGATVGPPISTVPVTAEWDEAFLRVESYLRAHHIESRVLINRLTNEIMTAARTLAARHPEEPPVTVAIQVAHARIGEWLTRALGEGDWTDERFRARGRLALLLVDVPRRDPESFLSPDKLPAEIRAQMSTARLHAGPELKLTSMPSAELQFPLSDAVEEKWETFSRSTVFRAAASWLVFAALLSAAWLSTR